MRSRSSRRAHVACAGVAIGIIPMFFAQSVHGADRSWIDSGGGVFSVAGNWSPANVPVADDVAHFTLNSEYTVSFTTNPTNQRMRLTQGTVTFALGGRTYAHTSTGLPTDPSIAVGVGNFPLPRSAHLIVSNGTLSGVNAMLGLGPVGSLSFPINGRISVSAGGRLNLSGTLVGGWETDGVVAVSGGGSFTSNGATLGWISGARGGVSVSGAGSAYTTTFVNVGLSGSGTMSVSADADVTTTMEAYIARFAGSTGSVTVSGAGSSWMNSGTLMLIGAAGAGSLTVSGGGAVTSTPPRIGDGTAGTGVAIVTGSGSRWNAAGTGGKIGNFGHGTFMITNGGTASFGPTDVGSEAGAVGTVTVSGAGSRWTTGIVSVGKTGTGHIAVTDGGVFSSANFVRLGGAQFSTGTGTGIMSIDGLGSRYSGGLYVEETSTFTVSNGGHADLTFVESFGTITLAGGTGSFGTVTGQFGSHGSGRINVTGGGSFSAQSIKQSVLNITANGRATVRPNGTDAAVSIVQNLALGGSPGAWQATLDLSDNDLIIDYDLASPMLNVIDQIRQAYNGGAWNGTGGITSSHANANQFALGYAESSAIFMSFPATFSGQSVDDTAVLVKFTRYGDANLDGVVNLADFNALAANFGQTSRFWRHGDFNYDGIVNLADFNRLAGNFGLSAGPDGPTAEDWWTLASAVPEPALPGMTCIAAWAALYLRPRWRRRL